MPLEIVTGKPLHLAFTYVVDGSAQDPAEITVTMRAPDGDIITKSLGNGDVLKTSTGVYYLDLADEDAPTQVGVWGVRMQSTAPAADVLEDTFTVQPSAVL